MRCFFNGTYFSTTPASNNSYTCSGITCPSTPGNYPISLVVDNGASPVSYLSISSNTLPIICAGESIKSLDISHSCSDQSSLTSISPNAGHASQPANPILTTASPLTDFSTEMTYECRSTSGTLAAFSATRLSSTTFSCSIPAGSEATYGNIHLYGITARTRTLLQLSTSSVTFRHWNSRTLSTINPYIRTYTSINELNVVAVTVTPSSPFFNAAGLTCIYNSIEGLRYAAPNPGTTTSAVICPIIRNQFAGGTDHVDVWIGVNGTTNGTPFSVSNNNVTIAYLQSLLIFELDFFSHVDEQHPCIWEHPSFLVIKLAPFSL